MNEEISRHLSQFNLDIRITRDARFMDQKVTPDVLCIIADCVLQFVENDINREFTVSEIWESEYANSNVKDIFNKPDVLTETARSEYDKFFAQPLKMLAYAQILKCEVRNGRNFFKVQNKELLNFISIKERNSLVFLVAYLEKVLKDSEVWEKFNSFFENNDKEHFDVLKSSYENFIIKNTPINTPIEVRRIFTKIINPLSYTKRLHGTKKGFYSEDVIGYDELMYNRKNWRDTKLRGETRQEYESRVEKIEKSKAAFISLTKEKIRRYHSPVSELHDSYAVGAATQVHHIFSSANFPKLNAVLENLILLTATQHNAYAHPNNNTRIIDRDYQILCLLAKSSSIQLSIEKRDGFYSKDDFVYVLNEGIKPQNEFIAENSFQEIEVKISCEYHNS